MSRLSASKTQQWLRIQDAYRKAHANAPARIETMIDWAAEVGAYKSDERAARKRAAKDMAEALRSLTTVDGHGDQVRVNLAFETEDGWLWDMRETISRPHMELHVERNRRLIYGEIKAQVLSVRDYNEHHPDEAPIQYSLNFAGDLADDGISLPAPIELEKLLGERPIHAADLPSARDLSRPGSSRPSSRPSPRV